MFTKAPRPDNRSDGHRGHRFLPNTFDGSRTRLRAGLQKARRTELLGKEGYPKARPTVLLGELAMLLGGGRVPQSSAGLAKNSADCALR